MLAELVPSAMEAYVDGLRDMGSSVDQAMVELGFAASVALRWAHLRDVLVAVTTPRPIFRGSAPHESAEEALEHLLGLTAVLFDAADRARNLATVSG